MDKSEKLKLYSEYLYILSCCSDERQVKIPQSPGYKIPSCRQKNGYRRNMFGL